MNPFWALRMHAEGETSFPMLERLTLDNLTPGEVLIEVHYSGINFKDALAVTARGKILKSFPLNPGIDAAGVVLSSLDPRYTPGQEVLVTGCGMGEMADGGFSEVVRMGGDAVVPLPSGLSMRESMILGTAGFTAALALHRLEQNGQRPSLGPMLVTGASGGVGSFATQLFSQAGYEVHAVSGKHESRNYLTQLGAKQILSPDQLDLGARPLERARFGGAIDSLGGESLAKVMSHVQTWGNVACVGLAESAELHTTVMPLILRGVSLVGISSNNCPRDLRLSLWEKLATTWRPKTLDAIVKRVVGLKDVSLACDEVMHRQVQGRILVEVRK